MTIQWAESVPSNASFVGNAPIDARSIWTAIETGMKVEHFWSGNSFGDLLPGASRAFVAARSASSVPSQGTGRLFIDTTNGRMYAFSDGTYVVGSLQYAEGKLVGTGLADGSTFFLRQAGAVTGIPTGSSSTLVTFPIPYTGTVEVVTTSSSISWYFGAASVQTINFTSVFSSFAGAASTATLYWEAFGVASTASA